MSSIERLISLTMYFIARFKNQTKSCSSTGWTLNQPLLWFFSSTQFDQFKPIEQWLISLVGSMLVQFFKHWFHEPLLLSILFTHFSCNFPHSNTDSFFFKTSETMVLVEVQISVWEKGKDAHITTCVYNSIKKQLIYTKRKTVLKFTSLFLPHKTQLKHKPTFAYHLYQ